jgi:hypothetical protein
MSTRASKGTVEDSGMSKLSGAQQARILISDPDSHSFSEVWDPGQQVT